MSVTLYCRCELIAWPTPSCGNPPKQRQTLRFDPLVGKILPFGPGSFFTSNGVALPRFVDTPFKIEFTCVMLKRSSFVRADVIRFVAPRVTNRLLMMELFFTAWA